MKDGRNECCQVSIGCIIILEYVLGVLGHVPKYLNHLTPGRIEVHDVKLKAYSDYTDWFWHCDAINWKYFLCYWPFVMGIHRWPVDSPHEVQRHGTLVFSLICTWTNGDLRRHRAHYGVPLMTFLYCSSSCALYTIITSHIYVYIYIYIYIYTSW